jgi:hypothetical protein
MKYQSIIIESKTSLDYDSLISILSEQIGAQVVASKDQFYPITSAKASIGIEDVSTVVNWSSRRSSQLKIVAIYSAEKLTNQAQNSLLKIIEEPDENTMIVLITNNADQLLETIKSRCIVFSSADEHSADQEIKTLAIQLLKSNYIEKLKIVEKIIKDYDNREKIGEFILEVIRSVKTRTSDFDKIEEIKKIYLGIKSGVNLKLSLDNLCILLSNR